MTIALYFISLVYACISVILLVRCGIFKSVAVLFSTLLMGIVLSPLKGAVSAVFMQAYDWLMLAPYWAILTRVLLEDLFRVSFLLVLTVGASRQMIVNVCWAFAVTISFFENGQQFSEYYVSAISSTHGYAQSMADLSTISLVEFLFYAAMPFAKILFHALLGLLEFSFYKAKNWSALVTVISLHAANNVLVTGIAQTVDMTQTQILLKLVVHFAVIGLLYYMLKRDVTAQSTIGARS